MAALAYPQLLDTWASYPVACGSVRPRFNNTQARHTMTIERTFQGARRISAMHEDHLFTRQYFGYTKREAIAEFKHDLADHDLRNDGR